jgi:hypothetical protein
MGAKRTRIINGVECRKLDSGIDRSPAKLSYIPRLDVDLLARLAPLEGKALAVYLILHRQAKIHGTQAVELSTARLSRIGLHRWHKHAALAVLENAGLIAVERRPRKNPLVTLLEE